MAKPKLSDDIINQIQLSPKKEKHAFTDERATGLQLIASWKGRAVRTTCSLKTCNYKWYFRYKIEAEEGYKRNQIKIGDWPEMNTSQAFNEAERLRGLVRVGIDPRTDKMKKRIKAIEHGNMASGLVPAKYRFEEVLKKMGETWGRTGKERATYDDYRQALEKHAYPRFYGKSIKTITGKEWDELITHIANVKKLLGAANNTHKAGRRLFSFAVEEELINYNPLLQRKKSLEATRLEADERFLEAHEVHKFLNEIDAQPIPLKAQVNLKLMIYVGVRVEEWERVKIGWINFKKMRIEHPPESMKNRKRAWTHLPEPTIKVLIEWLNVLKDKHGQLDPEFFLFPADDNPFAPERTKLSDHTSNIKEWIAFSPKLLRKTIGTHLQRQGCPQQVRRAIRNQTITDGVERNYDFDDLFHDKKLWIEKWTKLLEKAKESPKALITERDSDLNAELSTEIDDLFK